MCCAVIPVPLGNVVIGGQVGQPNVGSNHKASAGAPVLAAHWLEVLTYSALSEEEGTLHFPTLLSHAHSPSVEVFTPAHAEHDPNAEHVACSAVSSPSLPE